jgi:hypothetical protein
VSGILLSNRNDEVSTMASDAKTLPADDPTRPAPAAEAAEDADTEGHSFSIAMGVNQLGKGSPDTARARPPDLELEPLTKQWPRMREDKRG